MMQALVSAEPERPLDRLTAREREVLQWLSGGKTDRDIARILGISHRTVHKHLQRVYEKLGVETRTAAVLRALGVAELRLHDPKVRIEDVFRP